MMTALVTGTSRSAYSYGYIVEQTVGRFGGEV